MGRDFLLHDCDGFTKRWYKDNLGFSDEELQRVEIQEPIPPLAKPALAPYNGYGAIEDSLQNCLSLDPKPPRRDMHKLMNKDKIILRFKIKMVDTDTHKHSATDLGRRFVLSYFMMDDTLMVFEEPIRNSGIVGGRFLDRQKIYKPKSEEIFTFLDLYVGGNIVIFHRTFEMAEADEYTMTYMENNKVGQRPGLLHSIDQIIVCGTDDDAFESLLIGLFLCSTFSSWLTLTSCSRVCEHKLWDGKMPFGVLSSMQTRAARAN